MAVALAPGPVRPVGSDPDLQRLRWFLPATSETLARIARQNGTEARIDKVRLAAAYLDWRQAAEGQPGHLAAGLLLRALLHHAPLRITPPATEPAEAAETPVRFWPEGHAFVCLCLEIRRRLLGSEAGPGPSFSDLRTWWSFRENVTDDTALALPFLDLFAGVMPDWNCSAGTAGTPRPLRGRPMLWTVPAGPILPAETATIVFDLATLTNADDLSVQALEGYLAALGAPVVAEEVRQRFLHRPVGAAMTHVAERTGLICPGSFITDLEARRAALVAEALVPAEGAAATVAALSGGGLSVLVVVPDGVRPATLPALQAHFPEARIYTDGLSALFETQAVRTTTVISTSPPVIATAVAAGADALGIAGETVLRGALQAAGARQVLPADTALLRLTGRS